MSRDPFRETAVTNGYADGGVLQQRVIEPGEFVADTNAFLDVRIERSKGKASYSFIGPGVSQNAEQTINLVVPHGFNVGAATMPHGAINNPHLHFTAEVFICTAGTYRFDIGEHGGQTVTVAKDTIFSVPTWVFRSFENTGIDEGWLFTVLGGDDTGGIIWAPRILTEAAETGMFLSADYALLDAIAGDDVSEAVKPLAAEDLAGELASYTDEELQARSVGPDQLRWSRSPLLSSVLPGHEVAMAPVIGHGMLQERATCSPITNPHGFSLEWLEVGPDSCVGIHRHTDTQAVFLVEGEWLVDIEHEGVQESARPAEGSIVSVPPNAWRNFTNIGSSPARAVVVCGSDAPTRIEWSSTIVNAALEKGRAVDAAGYVGPSHLLAKRP